MIRSRNFAILGITACLSITAAGRADSVSAWNVIAGTTIVASVPPRAAPVFFLDYATVHAAIHDAVQAYQGRFETYAGDIAGATGDIDAAVAKAAHDVLVNRFPGQTATLDTTYNNY